MGESGGTCVDETRGRGSRRRVMYLCYGALVEWEMYRHVASYLRECPVGVVAFAGNDGCRGQCHA